MATKIVGFERKQGDYEGRPYDNYNLHVINNTTAGVTGYAASIVKVKTPLMVGVLSLKSEGEIPVKLAELINQEVILHYELVGKNPQLTTITLVNSK